MASIKSTHTDRKAEKRNTPPAVWALIITALAVIAGAVLITPMIFVGAKRDAVIRIPKNATDTNVHDSLTKYLGKSYADHVMRLLKVRQHDFSKRHGAYLIEKGKSPLRTQHLLNRGAQHPVRITVNGFRSLPLMMNRIADKTDNTPEELMRAATDPKILSEYGLTPEQALALFIDDTYEVYWSSTPEEIVRKIGANYKKTWSKRHVDKASNLGLTPAQVMILCSIVDEETLTRAEKGKIGRLYINRLNKGMRLQADPTVRFALNDFTIKRVRKGHLQTDSPYNTYRHAGLPPGPIRTTSVETIDLVLDSEPSDDLYMCAREDFSGSHNFAATYEEHLANSRKYQHSLDTLGIE